nr:N-acetylmuramoyl-L-alanine amidase [uncultured Bacillus sp.]
MVKIFIDPGHGGHDPGAEANGIQEKHLTLQICSIIRDILLVEYEDVSVLMSRTGDQTVSLDDRTNAANSWGADYYVSVHINSGGGNGFESYVYPGTGRRTAACQELVHQKIMEQISFVNRGMKQAAFHVLKESRMAAILTENGFIDHVADSAKLKDIKFIRQLARGHALGIAAAFQFKGRKGLSQPYQLNRSAARLIKVQIGAFKACDHAEQKAQQAKEKGFQVYISEENNLYKVQIGAFKERKHAEELAKQAKAAGLDTVLSMNE